MMLSILIPTFNYDAYPLVLELKQQCDLEQVVYEINVYDDCSTTINTNNSKINMLKNCNYFFLKKNVGRSSIRNLLAKNATYDTLLFLDVDTFPKKKNFIKKYINSIKFETEIIYGGIKYQKKLPKKNKLLRWVYGTEREALNVYERNKDKYLRFLTLNFLIKKSVFDKIEFNENIPNLRHEDTLFALNAKEHKINIEHINNTVFHYGLESSSIFLKKSLEAVTGLKIMISQKLISENQTSLSKKAAYIEKIKMSFAVIIFCKVFGFFIQKNLLSKNPSLFLFDVYRLNHYLKLKDD